MRAARPGPLACELRTDWERDKEGTCRDDEGRAPRQLAEAGASRREASNRRGEQSARERSQHPQRAMRIR